MANKKILNFEQYVKLYPEYTFVFIGDNGQADVSVGEYMLTNMNERMDLVLIHKVTSIYMMWRTLT